MIKLTFYDQYEICIVFVLSFFSIYILIFPFNSIAFNFVNNLIFKNVVFKWLNLNRFSRFLIWSFFILYIGAVTGYPDEGNNNMFYVHNILRPNISRHIIMSCGRVFDCTDNFSSLRRGFSQLSWRSSVSS